MTADRLPQPDAVWLDAFRRRLRTWYGKHRRDLPWRRNRDAYAIWISETMLQQTQVATVVPYFERFLARFPTVSDLAAADEAEVLRHWEGLGYYRRARFLHAAAKKVASDHDAVFPKTLEGVLGLPGIGRYTAGAILSIAYDARSPILEANTRRLLCRLLALREDPRKAEAEARLWTFAEALLPPAEGAGEVNQALMELGSLVCTPKAPDCPACPAKGLCPTEAAGLQASIPAAARRVVMEEVSEAAVAVFRESPGASAAVQSEASPEASAPPPEAIKKPRKRAAKKAAAEAGVAVNAAPHAGREVLLVQRRPDERWAGLWDFVRFPLSEGQADGGLPLFDPHRSDERTRLAERVYSEAAVVVSAASLAPIGVIRHCVTRFKITLSCWRAEWTADAPAPPPRDARWVPLDQLAAYPFSTTGRKIADALLAGRLVGSRGRSEST